MLCYNTNERTAYDDLSQGVLTQQDLADYTGLSLRIVKSIEVGKGNPSVATLSKIADTLGLELLLRVKEVVK